MLFDTKTKGYLQVDETSIKVLDSDKKGACHQGYYWVYHAPLDGTVLFDYSPTRRSAAPAPILVIIKAIFRRTDTSYMKNTPAERKLHILLAGPIPDVSMKNHNDRPRATKALTLIQKLYAVERRAREENLEPEAIKELRLKESLPVINEMGSWIFQEIKSTLPNSQIGKAMAYAMARWDALSAYLYDGNLQIDTNQCENALRPISLGRKITCLPVLMKRHNGLP